MTNFQQYLSDWLNKEPGNPIGYLTEVLSDPECDEKVLKLALDDIRTALVKPRSDDAEEIILTGTIGSHSYGTNTPASDYDYMSAVVAPSSYYFGLKNWGSNGTKETEHQDPEKGLVEHKYYEIKKFVSMCAGMNPNAVPILWLNPMHYEVITPAGNLFIKNRTLFNSKKAYHTFSGYAMGQLHKMGGVFNDNEEQEKKIKKGYQDFQAWVTEEIEYLRKFRDLEANGTLDKVRERTDFGYRYWGTVPNEGLLNALIALRTHSIEECKRIKDGPITGRMGAKRKELRAQFGYDTKFAFHTIRLMRMCCEFLEHPEEGLKVYRKDIDAEHLFSIRMGKFTQEEVKQMADELFARSKKLLVTTDLPDKPNDEAINNLTMDIIRSVIA